MKSVFEKRFDFNFKKYKNMSLEDLNNYEDILYNKVYKDFSDKEILCAEFEIIDQDLENEILNKQIDSDNLNYYKYYLKMIKKLQKKLENIDFNTTNVEDLRKILTIIQLSLNIKPSYITSINMNEPIELHNYLDNLDDKIFIKKG